jgi:hypothetical protein
MALSKISLSSCFSSLIWEYKESIFFIIVSLCAGIFSGKRNQEMRKKKIKQYVLDMFLLGKLFLFIWMFILNNPLLVSELLEETVTFRGNATPE